MTRNSYTSSERRGILAIAVIALLFIAAGVLFSLGNAPKVEAEEIIEVKEKSDLIDSTAIRPDQNKGKKKKKKPKNKENKTKTYRQRSPLDEPV